jgi:hypothetical protein
MEDWLDAIRTTVSKLRQYSVDPHSAREGFVQLLEGSKLTSRYAILTGSGHLKTYARKPINSVPALLQRT